MTVPSAWRVLLPLPLPPFTFLPPHALRASAAEVQVGVRVVVPWQSGVRIGILVGFEPLRGGAGLELREAIGVLDIEPFLRASALSVLERVAAYTCAPAGTVLANLLPTGLSVPLEHRVRALSVIAAEPVSETWQDAGTVPLKRLELYRQQGLLDERVRIAPTRVQRLVPVSEGDAALDGVPRANQRSALAHLFRLGQVESAAALARAAAVPETAVRALIKKGVRGLPRGRSAAGGVNAGTVKGCSTYRSARRNKRYLAQGYRKRAGSEYLRRHTRRAGVKPTAAHQS